MRPVGGNTDALTSRIDRATNILLESMGVYDSETARRLVIDALYLLTEGKERAK